MPIAWWTSRPAVACLWLIWFGTHAVRTGAAAVSLRKARRACRECPAEVQRRLPCWSRVRRAGRPTRVVISGRVRTAGVLGCGSPVVALSPALLEQLDDADLDRVVVHEWAHVQRHDDVAQLLQHLVRMIAGWHPAIWWLDRQLDFEREVACDEVAVDVTGSARAYAGCLATLATFPSGPLRPVPALAAVSSSRLHRRVVRILAARPAVALRPWRATAACASAPLAALAFVAGHLPLAGSASALSASPLGPPASAALVVPDAPSLLRPEASASTPVTRRRVRFAEGARGAKSDRVFLRAAAPADRPRLPALEPVAAMPVAGWPAGLRTVPVVAMTGPSAPVEPRGGWTETAGSMADTPPGAHDEAPAPWTAAADAGVSIGRGAQKAGVATAAFFGRFGRQIAGSF
jgi:hypothetical protein